MRLLECNDDGELSLTDGLGDQVSQYAILSHTWGVDTEEVTFRDLTDGTGKSKAGYGKIRFCAQQAKRDGLQYFWVDTCCIDKSNSTELAEAINSMFRWYCNAAKCYVYLSDVSITKRKASNQLSEFTWEPAFRVSRWFTRGWTLQELIAPGSVEFFSQEGKRLGDKRTLERQVHEITGIAISALQGAPLSQFGVDERLIWIENRQTTRKEDKAYSLLGIFDVYMPLIYGEGEDHALIRLREEIDKPSKGLDYLPYVIEASFNSYAKQHSPSCLPNTRVELLRDIYIWADREDERCIFWLNGLAGTGKSTIARTIARRYSDQKSLGASFFFSRGGGDVSHPGRFVTSIATQLAKSIPALRRYISDAIAECNDIANLSLRDQWQLLVLRPLSKLDDNSCRASYILVVDALDECDGSDNIRIILQLLAEARSLKRVRLRIFMTSRPEIPIRHGFYQMPETEHRDFVLHNISPSIIDHDITIFLEYNLRLISEVDSLDAGWPGAEAIKTLVQSASGLFIWAATACRFIREGPFADERLLALLKGGVSATTTPEEHLNEIYITVLQSSIQANFSQQEKERFCSMLREILGSVVTLLSPLSVYSLSRLLATSEQRVVRLLKDLHAILDIPNNHRPLHLHHPSFRDFLLNEDRCRDSNFLANENLAHQTLAIRCIQLMSASLKRDICGVTLPGTCATGIEQCRIEQCLPPEVSYACLYWIQHLQNGGAQLHDNDDVHQFLQTHLLHWLEALSWMRKISEGILAITSLEFITLSMDCPSLYAFIHDIKRFILYNRVGIEQAPLQIYCSALVFAPANSQVRKQFKSQMPCWVQRSPDVQKNWGSLLQTLEGHWYHVEFVTFSPDGKQLASASEATVRLWNVATGAALQTLEIKGCVRAVTFSPDGKIAVLTSGVKEGDVGGTVQLWDAATGAILQTLKIHMGIVYTNAVAFSPDCKVLASAEGGDGESDEDGMVHLWDAAAGGTLRTLKGFTRSGLAFSPDSKIVAFPSSSMTVRLWDTATGAALRTLESGDRVKAVVFSPDGKTVASALRSGGLLLWDVATCMTWQIPKGDIGLVSALAFSPDGKLATSGPANPTTIRLWDAATGVALQVFEGHTRPVSAVTFSPDGKVAASASRDQTVRLWDVATCAASQTLGRARVRRVAFSPDGTLVASASSDGTVQLWDVETVAALQMLEGHIGAVNDMAISPDGKIIALASNDTTVRLWDAATGAALHTFKDHTHSVRRVAFSPDSKMVASAEAYVVRLWDATTGAASQTLDMQTPSGPDFIYSVSFSPDSKVVAVGYFSKIRLWDIATGASLQMLEHYGRFIDALAFSPDGNIVASASTLGRVRLWNAATGVALQTLLFDKVDELFFSSEGLYLNNYKRGLSYVQSDSAGIFAPAPPPLQTPFRRENWLTQGGENLLWLPPNYRDLLAFKGNVFVFRDISGRVVFLTFSISVPLRI